MSFANPEDNKLRYVTIYDNVTLSTVDMESTISNLQADFRGEEEQRGAPLVLAEVLSACRELAAFSGAAPEKQA